MRQNGFYTHGVASCLVIFTLGVSLMQCATTIVAPGGRRAVKASAEAEVGQRALSKKDLDYVIDANLSRVETISYLQRIAVKDFEIQDPNTNWAYATIGGRLSGLSIYYLTYRQTFFILLLMDSKSGYSNCVDAVTLPRSSKDYDLGMGPVEVDRDHYDGDVVVIFNKEWRGSYSDDIIAAFKANIETRRIEAFKYQYIRIYREE